MSGLSRRVLVLLLLLFALPSCASDNLSSNVPSRIKSVGTTNEALAVRTMDQIIAAQEQFFNRQSPYARRFHELVYEHLLPGKPAIDDTGYVFTVHAGEHYDYAGTYFVMATPVFSQTAKHFFRDPFTKKIHVEDGKQADGSSPELQR